MSTPLVTDDLAAATADQVLTLAEAARRTDGVAPLSEHTLLRVRHGAPSGSARFHVVSEDGRVVGFAFVERGEDEPDSGEVVVDPAHRGRGHGTALLHSVHRDAGANGVRVWAHGRTPQAVAVAEEDGWRAVRELHKMRMPLRDIAAEEKGGPRTAPELPPPVLRPQVADRVEVRAFVVGQDEQAWLDTNARAFAHHPEQGRLTLDDLLQREVEDWFDPNGFFLATGKDGRVAAYHWTKVHADGAGLTDGEPVGEVYVVGVDPQWQGTGLGRALTLEGLRHLRDAGLPWVHLYVDGDNEAAVRLYTSLGFEIWDTDVMYAPPEEPPGEE
ncbi:mycothiol synthase [Nocardiopsis changdeensis]|uniref:Mycothiol acetyltransferase n=1 Tax=Nocardiopsis changdeensis TaxID=2831969 RepID=A0ABX8BQF9_9ACTN|nr:MULTISPECIES: mycothiol synthase [Nocardiopsis]QKW32008.1 mycothiol synthase [Nocardiopsis flavescens]QUX23317.1 mycothiol synthase [Nocardiopsis changdeensis]QYX39259.1 mycothiol synthase [Nocardiopsis sp. MT53]